MKFKCLNADRIVEPVVFPRRETLTEGAAGVTGD